MKKSNDSIKNYSSQNKIIVNKKKIKEKVFISVPMLGLKFKIK